jgi:hypothetical protein
MSLQPNHVWLRAYQLSEAIDENGPADDERTRVLVDDMLGMPPELQQQTLGRLERVSDVCARIAEQYRKRAKEVP